MNSYELLVSILLQNPTGMKTMQLFQAYICFQYLCCLPHFQARSEEFCQLYFSMDQTPFKYISRGNHYVLYQWRWKSCFVSSVRTHCWELYTLLLSTGSLRTLLNEVHINILSLNIWDTELFFLSWQEIENFRNNWEKNPKQPYTE